MESEPGYSSASELRIHEIQIQGRLLPAPDRQAVWHAGAKERAIGWNAEACLSCRRRSIALTPLLHVRIWAPCLNGGVSANRCPRHNPEKFGWWRNFMAQMARQSPGIRQQFTSSHRRLAELNTAFASTVFSFARQ
jgi:hypothetical protein